MSLGKSFYKPQFQQTETGSFGLQDYLDKSTDKIDASALPKKNKGGEYLKISPSSTAKQTKKQESTN